MATRTLLIRQLLAGFFLLLFAFGITPKLTLHNLASTHQEGRKKASSSLPDPATAQLSTAAFNCQLDNPLTESPFVPMVRPLFEARETAFAAYRMVYVASVYASQRYCSALRGPPAC